MIRHVLRLFQSPPKAEILKVQKAIILFAIILPFHSYSQINKDSIWKKDLIGIWQKETPALANGYDQVYIFYSDGSYKLVADSWYATSNNYGFKGRYKIKKGTQNLTITIDSTIEGSNCHYKYDDEPGWGADWILVCDTTITHPYKKTDNNFEISIEWTLPDEKFKDWDEPLKCILMDSKFKYYKVSDKTTYE